EQRLVGRRKRRQVEGHQAYRQYRRRQLLLFQTATGQLEQHGGLALGAQQADRHLAVGQVAVLQMQDETLHAPVAAGQEGGQIGGQAAQREEQRLMGLHLEVQLDAFLEDVRWPVELQGQRALAEQAVQLDQ